jgi:hypothetical protein
MRSFEFRGEWAVRETAAVPHVVPIDDLRQHDVRYDCWCKPTDDGEVFIHNSLDGREFFEVGAANAP